MTLGQRIREKREILGLSQEKVAEQMGVSRQAVGKWESDDARPSTENLLRLAQLLGTDVQDLATGEAALPPQKRFPWRAAALALGGLSLVLALLLLLPGRSSPPSEGPDSSSSAGQLETEGGTAPQSPECIQLERERLYDFAPVLTDSAPVEEKLPENWEEDILCQLPLGEGQLLVVAAPSNTQSGTAPQCDLWAVNRSGPEEPWTALCRFAEGCTHLEELQAAPFFRTLGYSGWRLTPSAADYEALELLPSSYYFSLDASGTPVMALTLSGSECREWDLDGDGERELVSLSRYDWGQVLEIYDRAGDGFYRYDWRTYDDSSFLGLDEEGFYLLQDPEGPRWTKLRDSALYRGDLCGTGGDPAWDALTPDVMDVTISFVYDQFSHGQDPDAVLERDSLGAPMPTDRQYARLALQCLYDLTGWKPESVWCLATEFSVLFSLYEDGFSNRSYFTFGKWYDPENIPELRLTWAEEEDWSPLSAAQAAGHMGTEQLTGMDLAQAWYDRLSRISGGPIVDRGIGPYFEPALFLADGRSFRVDTNDDLHVLTYLQGPYPKDFTG